MPMDHALSVISSQASHTPERSNEALELGQADSPCVVDSRSIAAAPYVYTGELGVSMWYQPQKMHLGWPGQFPVSMAHAVVVLSGCSACCHSCSGRSPCALPRRKTPAARCLFPCWLAFWLLVPPRFYLGHELQDTGSNPEYLQFFIPTFLMEFGQSVILSGPIFWFCALSVGDARFLCLPDALWLQHDRSRWPSFHS